MTTSLFFIALFAFREVTIFIISWIAHWQFLVISCIFASQVDWFKLVIHVMRSKLGGIWLYVRILISAHQLTVNASRLKPKISVILWRRTVSIYLHVFLIVLFPMFDAKVRESMTFISITCITHAIFRINIQRQFKIIVWLMDQFKIVIPQSSLRVSWCIPSDLNCFLHLLNFGVCIRYRLLNWTHLSLEASIIVLHESFVMNRS